MKGRDNAILDPDIAMLDARHGAEELRPVGEVEFANGIAAIMASGVYGPCREPRESLASPT